jgi:hypothetical protein
MTLRSASWSAFVLLCMGLSCSDSDDSPTHPPPPVEEAGSGATGGTAPTELGGTGGSGARGGTGNQGNQGGEGDGCEPIECALTCDIADGAPEKGGACTELGNHCEDAVFDSSRCECRTTDYYCCDERWGTNPCERSSGAAGSDAGGAAGAS